MLMSFSYIDMPSISTGTCIVYIQTPDRVWVGADSLTTQLKTGGTDLHDCKIYRLGSVLFAFAGAKNLQDVYDAKSIAEDAIRSGGTPEKARDIFAEKMKPLFEKAVPVLQKFYTKYYNEAWENPSPKFYFFEIIFFGFENGTTSVKYAGFQVQKTAGHERHVEVKRDGCSRKDCAEKGIVGMLGKNKAFTAPGFNPQTLAAGNPVATIHKMIELETAAEPQWVGGDINIIRTDANGAHWETDAPACRGR